MHPDTNKAYIVSISGGKNNSSEGRDVMISPASFTAHPPDHEKLQKGLTHGFVVEFASLTDRDYYTEKDPVHAKLGKALLEGSEIVTVLDYEVGVF